MSAVAAGGVDRADLFAEHLRGAVLNVPGGFGGGDAQLFGELADLGELAGEQARDLRLQRAGVDDLAERGVRRQRQQIAGHVEGAGLQRALVGLGLHLFGPRDGGLQGLEHAGADVVVGGEEGFDGGGERRASRRRGRA